MCRLNFSFHLIPAPSNSSEKHKVDDDEDCEGKFVLLLLLLLLALCVERARRKKNKLNLARKTLELAFWWKGNAREVLQVGGMAHGKHRMYCHVNVRLFSISNEARRGGKKVCVKYKSEREEKNRILIFILMLYM